MMILSLEVTCYRPIDNQIPFSMKKIFQHSKNEHICISTENIQQMFNEEYIQAVVRVE